MTSAYYPKITIRAGQFLDSDGRQVLLHGINLVNKDPQAGYLGDENGETFALLRRWGFNCIRLGVIWDGLEPEPGNYNRTYLEGIERQLDWAYQNGLYVFLDMHQDLYSVLYSDGAPGWATLHEGQPHVGDGAVWSDAYFTSPAVQTALENFWNNAPAPDGAGLQDHLAACWKLLAQRFGSHPALIGYDLLNEPVPGLASPQALALQFARGAELLAQTGLFDSGMNSSNHRTEDLLRMWSTPDGRFQILQILSDPKLYAEVLEAPRPIYNQFEQLSLVPFYLRTAQAIRSVDPHGLLFLETSMGSNMGIFSAIEPLILKGVRDPQQVYAPHGYDLVVDTPHIAQASPERVRLIFHRHAVTARSHHWPMLVGEWGAYGFNPGTLPAARAVVRIFEETLCSDTYWAYQDDLDQADCFPALSRPFPEKITGALESYHYDAETGLFRCVWVENPAVTAPTVIYLPVWFHFDPQQIHPRPTEIVRQAAGVWLVFAPLGQAVRREFTAQNNELAGQGPIG
jgi:endoglycosylceramidase